jgi:hypothetical protein
MKSKQEVIAALESGRPFAFSRWGDGEWIAVLGDKTGKRCNCDGHHYFKDMSDALTEVLLARPTYLLGIQRMAISMFEDDITRLLSRCGMTLDDFSMTCGLWHSLGGHNNNWEFKRVFESARHIMVGPSHLRPLFDKAIYVEVPGRDCWLATDVTLDSIRRQLDVDEFTRVGFCASMPANVWIDRLWSADKRHAYIDFGACFDPLVGVASRGYMRDPAYKLPDANRVWE